LYDNWQEIPDGSRDSISRRFTKQTLAAAVDDIKNRPEVSDAELKSYSIAALYQRIKHYRVYTHNTVKLGAAGELQATLGFQQSVRQEFTHPTMPDKPGLNLVLNTWNYDLKFNVAEWKGIETTLGLNGMYQNNEHGAATDFPIPGYDLLDIGAFIYAKKSLGKLDISGGVRYDTRKVNWTDFYVVYNTATGFTEQAQNAAVSGANLQFPSFSRQYAGMSGSLGATYNITDKIVVKANVARGYRAPNITESGSNGLDPGAHIVYMGNRSFDPEFALQEDIGLIGSFKNVDVSLELFNNNIDNFIYMGRLYDANGAPVVISPGNITYQFQQSRAQLYGGELSVNFHPQSIAWLNWNNSFSYVEGLNRNDGMIAKHGNAARYLPFIPPVQFRTELKASIKQHIGRMSGIYFRTTISYNAAQQHFYGVDNTETATEAYTLVGAGCGATINTNKGRELLKLFFQAENITDVAYQSNMNRLKYFEYYSASPNGRSGIYNMGRNLSMKVVVPF
jgi:iron complex outermembrane receptor protein